MITKDFLLEIGVEELPTKSLLPLATSLEKNLTTLLEKEKITFAQSAHYTTPRRLAVLITDVCERQATQIIERQGPAQESAFDQDGTPTLACIGFAKSCGVTADQIQIKKTDKGNRIYCRVEKAGELTESLLPSLIKQALERLPISKPMRWGKGETSFVRPVHWILAMLGESIINVQCYQVTASNKTYGHRFHSPQGINIKDPKEYEKVLEQHYVIANFSLRKQRILSQVEKQEAAYHFKIVIDDDLLEEITALVEWPVVLIGKYADKFLKIPPEVLITSIKVHQKCFPIVNDAQQLQPFFATVSNISSKDPNAVISGNERVINARLNDAAFFFENDSKKPLSYFNAKLAAIIFEKDLGSLQDRVNRLQETACQIAAKLHEDLDNTKKAAALCKFDLVTEMVAEFPELQGVMGRYYALAAKENPVIADAIKAHYYPRFSKDCLPEDKLSCIIALADRLDSLCGIFGIHKIPSGEKDPYALRRAAQGVTRILIEKKLDIDLMELIKLAAKAYPKKLLPNKAVVEQVFQFIMERMRFWYQDLGINAQLFESVRAKDITNPLDFHQRLEAVQQFLNLNEAQALSEANKRVSNLLKKESSVQEISINPDLFESDSEQLLYKMIDKKDSLICELYQTKKYSQTLKELADFKTPIDSFFNDVMVMVEQKPLRDNRLALLSKMQQLFTVVADISLL